MLTLIFFTAWGVLMCTLAVAFVVSSIRMKKCFKASLTNANEAYIPPADSVVRTALDMHKHPQSEVIRAYTDPSSTLFPIFHRD